MRKLEAKLCQASYARFDDFKLNRTLDLIASMRLSREFGPESACDLTQILAYFRQSAESYVRRRDDAWKTHLAT